MPYIVYDTIDAANTAIGKVFPDSTSARASEVFAYPEKGTAATKRVLLDIPQDLLDEFEAAGGGIVTPPTDPVVAKSFR